MFCILSCLVCGELSVVWCSTCFDVMVCLQKGGHLVRSMLTGGQCVFVGSTVGRRRFVLDDDEFVEDGFVLIDLAFRTVRILLGVVKFRLAVGLCEQFFDGMQSAWIRRNLATALQGLMALGLIHAREIKQRFVGQHVGSLF